MIQNLAGGQRFGGNTRIPRDRFGLRPPSGHNDAVQLALQIYQNFRFQSPEFPIRSSKSIRHSRSDSPRSITCKGVEPSKAGFGLSSHGPICEAGTTSASASKRRDISETFL